MPTRVVYDFGEQLSGLHRNLMAPRQRGTTLLVAP